MNISKNDTKLSTSVYRKPTDTGLYLHYDSYIDHRYKASLLKTMLYRACRLSSTWKAFTNVCLIKMFVTKIDKRSSAPKENCSNEPIVITTPFKDKRLADDTKKKQLMSLGNKNGVRLQPVFTSRKIGDVLKSRELKPRIINQQCVVYRFKCGLCDMDYVGYTNWHLHQRVAKHSLLNSSIGKHIHVRYARDTKTKFN